MTVTGKAARLIAERAQRQRKEAKLAARRSLYKDSLDQVLEEERQALLRKHAVSTASTSSSHQYGHSLSRTGHSTTAGSTLGGTGGALTPAALAAISHSHF